MACHLMAPNQCWNLISKVMWHSPESNFTASAQATILYMSLKNMLLELFSYLWGASELRNMHLVPKIFFFSFPQVIFFSISGKSMQILLVMTFFNIFQIMLLSCKKTHVNSVIINPLSDMISYTMRGFAGDDIMKSDANTISSLLDDTSESHVVTGICMVQTKYLFDIRFCRSALQLQMPWDPFYSHGLT